jgi:hypothetical protein
MQATTGTQELFEYIKLLVSVASFGSIVIAFCAYRTNLKKIGEDRIRDKDKELLAQIKNSFEWAFGALTNDAKCIPPEPDRINWLTSARHLLRAEKLIKSIENQTYKIICAEVEEYWRHKFYMALSNDRLRSWDYYADTKRPDWPENIEISSALVIIDFSNWKEGAIDPTDAVDREAMINSGQGIKGGNAGRGLEGYIVRLNEIRIHRNSEGSTP